MVEVVGRAPTRRSWWVRALAWWPVLPLLVGVALLVEAKQRYEAYTSVYAGDIAVLQVPDPRPLVVCGSDYHPGGYPGLVADRCEALMADRAATTRLLFGVGVVAVLVGVAVLVRHVGPRRAWPYVALGAAVACWYGFTWLLHLPLEGGACGSLAEGETGGRPGCGVRGVAGSVDLLLLLATGVLGGAGAAALVRRSIRWVAAHPGA